MNTACAFLGCPIAAHAQRFSQAVKKHQHLPDGSIPFYRNGTRAYLRLAQGRWTLVAPQGQPGTMQPVQAPQQSPLATPPQQLATGQHLAPFLRQQQPARMAAPLYMSSPHAAASNYQPSPALAPTPRSSNISTIGPNPSIRRMASDTLTPPPTKRVKMTHPAPSIGKPIAPLITTTPTRHIAPAPPIAPAMTQIRAQEQAQQQLPYPIQRAKENRIATSQHHPTPSSGVGRPIPAKMNIPRAKPPVARKTPIRPAEERAVHLMPRQTPEALHEHRLKDWWSTNPYGDQSQLYLPGSGVPPGVRLCHGGECVACEKIEA